MAVLPHNYPAEVLGPEELTALQDNIKDEVYNGCGYTGSFHGVYFRSGMLLVDCKDEKTATWLAEIAPKLNGLKGPVLCARRDEDIPAMHSMTVFLPRSAGKPYEFAIGLIRNQNDGLSASAWRVEDSSIEDAGWRLNITIDDESYKFIRKEGFKGQWHSCLSTSRRLFGTTKFHQWSHISQIAQIGQLQGIYSMQTQSSGHWLPSRDTSHQGPTASSQHFYSKEGKLYCRSLLG